MIIKICGMQHANDVKMASQIGVNLLGFDFIPQSPRYVKMISSQAGIIPDFSVERLRALSQQANTPQPQPTSISRVGVFADDMPQKYRLHAFYNYALDYVQLKWRRTLPLPSKTYAHHRPRHTQGYKNYQED